MSFVLRWLGLERGRRAVGLHPYRELKLALPYDDAYSKVLAALEFVLGASVRVDDRRTGRIEAGVGLVNSERVRASLTRLDDGATNVRVEAIFPAGAEVPERSLYVEALADALTVP
jgi:hypothetical protein